ncbi:MAG TPA: hypothetical protein VFX70_10675 [Mycobacteriales bacterium]|nr:hypothetical protein [Mycobacteriales bacterium]
MVAATPAAKWLPLSVYATLGLVMSGIALVATTRTQNARNDAFAGYALVCAIFGTLIVMGLVSTALWWVRVIPNRYISSSDGLFVMRHEQVVEYFPWRDLKVIRVSGRWGIRDLFQWDAGISMFPRVSVLDGRGWRDLPALATVGARSHGQLIAKLRSMAEAAEVRFEVR